ncbi:adhesion G protein-coupled receptor L3-like isoform X4 [Dreissena polymorpha]|uniref:adhesion G protein-coupled receptor L3-like isoform X4 n=1 Tax=Dreissena polymorpha TaxID=45954 RepID=UPI002263E280|nr:adhesion G protein-coupled receptor L3-like isoform X4 [Dreissena polymorpha]
MWALICTLYMWTMAGQTAATSMHLVGGPSSYEGRVEVYFNGIWGTVCDDGFDNRGAAVVCNMLNLPSSGAQLRDGAYYGQGTGTIWLDDVRCLGNENDIDRCPHSAWGTHNCRHGEDVGVVCAHAATPVRLVGGPAANEGRVEVFYQGVWGSVCDDLFDTKSAAVVCNMLNMTSYRAQPKPGAYYGPGTTTIWLDDVRCNGNETNIDMCQHNAWGTNNCNHSKDVGVLCDQGCGAWNSDSSSVNYQTIKYKNGTTFGAEAVMTCYSGYHVVNKTNTRSESAICTGNGTWSTPTYSACVHTDCGGWYSDSNSDNHHQIKYKNATRFGSEAVMTCNPGYHVVNKTNTRSESAYCTENGTWSAPTYSACVPIDCGKWYSDSSLDNHQPIIYKNATTFGSDAEMTCNPGYHVVNKTNTRFESATCTANGTWSPLTYSACVPIECPVLDTNDNLTIELAPNPSKAISNTTATFSCSPGTTLVGLATLTCRITGQWTGPAPKCIVLQEYVGNCSIDMDTKKRTWNETQPGRIVEDDCPSGFFGKVSRQCSQEGKWLKPFYNCVSKRVAELISTVERLKESPTAAKITDSLDQLVNVTKPANGTAYIGELNAITDMLDTIASVSDYKEVTHEQANSFFTATSNLLDSDNAESWQSGDDHYETDVPPDGSNTSTADYGAMKVVNVVDKYTDILMLSLGNESDTSKTIPTYNMVVHVTQINKTAAELKFPNFSSSIILPNTSLIGSHSIGAVLYKNLTGLISSVLKNYSESTINSEVVTVTLDNWENTTDFVVDITMKYAQDLHAPPICSFWNATIFSWDTSGCRVLSSEHSSATCRCTHLTNFAVLMSPIIQSNVNTKDLDIISIVGCSISLAGLGLTVIVHIVLWKYVGKRRVAVLLNLSIALIISYVMFIGGIDRTENKIVCTTVASLLHYIYLVVFSLMLVEGIDIAVSILIVFKTKSKLKWMLTASWVAPAVIVGTTLGVTKTEGYGNEQSCWLTIKEGVIWAFVGPALLVVLVNFVILVIVIRATLRSYAMAKKSTVERSKSAVRCLVVLLPLMGLTWVLGVFYLDESMAWVQYAFAVCNSLQGFVIFLFHCAFNKTLWKAYKTKQQRSSYASSTYLKSRSTSVRSITTEHSEVCMTVHDQSRISSVNALANTRFSGLPDRKPMHTTEVTDKEEHIDGIVEHFEKSANDETIQRKDDAKSVNTDRNDVGMENKTQQDFYSEVL